MLNIEYINGIAVYITSLFSDGISCAYI